MRRSLIRIVWLIGLLGPIGLRAQVHPSAVRHNCWDIELEVDNTRPPFRSPHIVAEADSGLLLVGMAVAFFVSLFVIRFLMRYIRRHDFRIFGWYRIVLGVIVLVYFVFFH